MSEDQFWALIDATAALEADPDSQLVALHSALQNLSAGDIEAFEAFFGEQLRRSYTWDLWGADYVVHGGASDDSFEYFRRWLISKGRKIFELVLSDPDGLADILAPDSEGVLEFEEFAYVARNVWSAKTHRSSDAMPQSAETVYLGLEPAGTPFMEDKEHLAVRYPRLWRRFGESPLY